MRKNLIFLLSIVIAGLTGCNKEEEQTTIYDLYFAEKEYHGQLQNTFSISVIGGNKDYTITPADPDMLTYKLDTEGAGLGSIIITPLKKGITTIQVKDNITSQQETLKINITDKYLYLTIAYINPEQPQIKINNTDPELMERISEKMKEELTDKIQMFALINNEKKSFYRVDNESELGYDQYGHYSLEEKDEKYFLIFYPLIECGGTPKEVYQFDTSQNFPGFTILNNYFEVNWITRSDFTPPYLYLKKDLTDQLKEEFPELESAYWNMQGMLSTSGKIPLEWFE